jgi:hypothetical protein
MIELTTGIAFLLSSMYGGGIVGDTLDVQPITTSFEGNRAQVVSAVEKKELENYLKENFADTPVLIEIARCESELRHFNENGKVLRGRVDNADVGVMQINERYHLETAKKLGFDIHTVEGNVAYAKYLYEKSGSEPWKASSPCWSKTLAAKEVAKK